MEESQPQLRKDERWIADIRKNLLLKVVARAKRQKLETGDIMKLFGKSLCQGLNAEAILFFLVEGNFNTLKHAWLNPEHSMVAEMPPENKEKLMKTMETLQLNRKEGILGKAVTGNKTQFYPQPGKEDFHPARQLQDLDIISMITVPVVYNDKAVGAIQVINKENNRFPRPFSHDDQVLIEELTEYIGPLILKTQDSKFEVTPADFARFMSRYAEVPLVERESDIEIDGKLVELIGETVIRREMVFPFKTNTPGSVSVLMVNPLDFQRRDQFSQTSEYMIDEVRVASSELIEMLIKRFFASTSSTGSTITAEDINISEIAEVIGSEYENIDGEIASDDVVDEDSAPIIQLANRIIEDAYIAGASDIHVEPQENDLMVRYRIDGLCQEKLKLPRKIAASLCTRFKIMADLDIAEKRLPQDGRIIFKKYTRKNIDVDLRVASGPMNYGEKIVMRILDKQKSTLPLTALGFSEENLETYRRCINEPYGMILHCGPTGSGKSMTLYSALKEIYSPELNIQTAEDPIEYTLPGINQMQMHSTIGLNFARALRAYLRMDPDIILVGEIRDTETAGIAIEAALTGHLLFSTLHTNDAPSTVARLTDMGIERFMISACLVAVCAQRLMRRVCKQCRMEHEAVGREEEILKTAIQWSGTIFKPNPDGCPMCSGSGYKGRVGIHEVMTNSEDLTVGINEGRETTILKRLARENGMKTLHQDSMLKVKQGLSTLEESLGTVSPDF